MGNARAYTWDKREVEHPRLFHSLNLLLTAESGVAVGIKTLIIMSNKTNEQIERNKSSVEPGPQKIQKTTKKPLPEKRPLKPGQQIFGD
ncbi:MAG: hypothetical protein IJ199_01660 [Prevotella sp.]|nr:hypothetical protein [Prevotella sp.]